MAKFGLDLDSKAYNDLSKKVASDTSFKPLWKLPNLPRYYSENPTMTYYKARDHKNGYLYLTFTKNLNSVSVNWNCYFDFPDVADYFYEQEKKKVASPLDPKVDGIFRSPVK